MEKHKIELYILIVVAVLVGEVQLLANQALIDYIGSHLSVRVGVHSNFDRDPDDYVSMQLILSNNGSTAIPNEAWKVYFSNLYGAKVEQLDCGLRIDHVNGDLFYLSPTSNFSRLEPGSTLFCLWHQKHWNTAISDFFPNWFVSANGTYPKVINSTNETFSFILPYDTPQKWKRLPEDNYNPFTPQERYEMHRLKTGSNKEVDTYQSSIVPTPFREFMSDNNEKISFSREDGWVIERSDDFLREAKYLSNMVSLPVVKILPSSKYVQFQKDADSVLEDEAYLLNISSQRITITAKDSDGVFYGIQSLLSLLQDNKTKVPVVNVEDKPRFHYRGLMIDLARSYKPKEWIFELLDVMAMYKLNKLHLHLSDDGAWRLQIPDIPELTEMGAKRCLRNDENPCLIPQRGSGPDNSTSGSGYYTVKDYKDILRYAKSRHVVIIPEFDMPGHSRAAVASMEYRDSKITDSSDIKTYTLSDTYLDSNVRSTQHWQGNVMNPCLNTTYSFVSKVLDELIKMHRGIMDLKIFHMGGDEVADGSLDGSPACQNMPVPKTTEALKRHFVKRVAEIAANKSLDFAVWEDGAYAEGKPNPIIDFASKDIYTYTWYNTWDKGRGNRSAQFADAGYKVILSLATHLYLDHSQEPDPQEMGLYWATRYTNTEKTFGFMPDDIFANAEVTRMGHPVDLEDLCINNWCPKMKKPENVIGIQACMFSDQIRNKEQMHHALFPRLIAVAERAWHKAPWESMEDNGVRDGERRADWERMVKILGYKELPRLELLNVEYRIPPPGAMMEDNVLKVNTLYPNHEVMMSTDGGQVWSTVSTDGHKMPAINSTVHLKSVSPVLRRTSRVITFEASMAVSQRDEGSTISSTTTANLGCRHFLSRSWILTLFIFVVTNYLFKICLLR